MKKRLPILLLVTMIIASVTFQAHTLKAATITETVNLASINQNVYGDGYTWMNMTATLTLENLNINTADEYGFKLPPNATIILKGKNTISAAKIALYCQGNTIIQGNGNLTLNATDMGIECVPNSSSTSLKIAGGNVTINATTYGIYGEATVFSQIGGKLTITTSSASSGAAYAIHSGNMQLNSGKLKTNSPLKSDGSVTVSGADIEISSDQPAITATKGITIVNTSTIKVGENLDALSTAEQYNGENALKIIPKSVSKRGVLYNGKYHVFWDYATFFSIILGVGCIIALPIYYKRKKTLRLIALQQENSKEKNKANTNDIKRSSNKSRNIKSGTKNRNN